MKQMKEKEFSGLAIAGFILSFFGVFFIPAILAVVFSAIGLRQINKDERQGKGLAIAGLVIGIVGLLFWIWILIVMGVSLLTMIEYISSF